MSDDYIVTNKREGWYNGRRVTLFKLWHCESDARFFAGEYAAPGWRLSKARCIQHAKSVMQHAEDVEADY